MRQRDREWVGTIARVVVVLVLLAPAVAWAASEAGREGGLISLDKSLIVQGINFLILLFILQRLLYKPFLAKMEERTQAIQRSLDQAQAARAEAARQQEENETRLRAAHAEAAAIRAQALKEAAEEQRRLVDAARVESQRLVETAKAQMDAGERVTSSGARSPSSPRRSRRSSYAGACATRTTGASSPTRSRKSATR